MLGPRSLARPAPRPSPRLTASVGQTLALLALPAAGLLQRLAVEAAETPALRLVAPAVPGWRIPVLDPDGLTAPEGSLIAHVLHQIGNMRLSPRERAIALVLAEALEPTGWLGTPTARLARTIGLDEPQVLAVLDRLQGMEPGGLFARNLAECLRLQADHAGELTPVLATVLDHLPLLASGGPRALERQLGLPAIGVASAVARIRGYDPKPGTAFAGPVLPLPPADLLLREVGPVWEAVPNPHSFSLEIDPDQPGRGAAEALRRAVEGRLRIALALGNLLAQRQSDWLSGRTDMAPVTTRDLADETGFHIATVNRCLAAVTARMPLGTRPLRALVSHAVDGATSAGALRQRLQALIRAAGPDRPSDAALTAQLAREGITVARRTVTKYRLALTGPARGG